MQQTPNNYNEYVYYKNQFAFIGTFLHIEPL